MMYDQYYEALAEQLMFGGLDERGVLSLGEFREGKSFGDLANAIGEEEGEFCGGEETMANISSRLAEIVEIDTSIPLPRYLEKLRSL